MKSILFLFAALMSAALSWASDERPYGLLPRFSEHRRILYSDFRPTHLDRSLWSLSFDHEGLASLQTLSLWAMFPLSSGTVGAEYSTFGYAAYRRHHLALAFYKRLHPKVEAGLRFTPSVALFAGEGARRFSWTIDATTQWALAPLWKAGVHLFVPLRWERGSRFTAPSESFLRLEMAYAVGSRLLLSAVIKKDLIFPLQTALQIDYNWRKDSRLLLNVGLRGESSLGLSFRRARWEGQCLLTYFPGAFFRATCVAIYRWERRNGR